MLSCDGPHRAAVRAGPGMGRALAGDTRLPSGRLGRDRVLDPLESAHHLFEPGVLRIRSARALRAARQLAHLCVTRSYTVSGEQHGTGALVSSPRRRPQGGGRSSTLECKTAAAQRPLCRAAASRHLRATPEPAVSRRADSGGFAARRLRHVVEHLPHHRRYAPRPSSTLAPVSTGSSARGTRTWGLWAPASVRVMPSSSARTTRAFV